MAHIIHTADQLMRLKMLKFWRKYMKIKSQLKSFKVNILCVYSIAHAQQKIKVIL